MQSKLPQNHPRRNQASDAPWPGEHGEGVLARPPKGRIPGLGMDRALWKHLEKELEA